MDHIVPGVPCPRCGARPNFDCGHREPDPDHYFGSERQRADDAIRHGTSGKIDGRTYYRGGSTSKAFNPKLAYETRRKALWNRVREHMKKNRLSEADLAFRMRIDKAYLARLKAGVYPNAGIREIINRELKDGNA